MQLLDGKVVLLNRAGDHRLKVRLGRQRIEPEHVEQLGVKLLAALLPVFQLGDIGEASVAELEGLLAEIVEQHPVAARSIGLGSREDGCDEQNGDSQKSRWHG